MDNQGRRRGGRESDAPCYSSASRLSGVVAQCSDELDRGGCWVDLFTDARQVKDNHYIYKSRKENDASVLERARTNRIVPKRSTYVPCLLRYVCVKVR